MELGFALTGSALWSKVTTNETAGTVTTGSLLNNRTVLSLTLVSRGMTYAVKMRSVGGEFFEGTWASGNRENYANASLYVSQNGGYFLFGKWKEVDEYLWWVTLEKGEVVTDEDI